ncbi:phosphatases II [Parathielavia appendiculata]|uniref:protein-tyrosine-phosphatase n=1 Tax=Parathielavia appendiculata TaxID=2587402 RepID=A0AAN6YZZ1_9PEZI|nr:phosphatases II [Parathielavia appendiculata]
MALNRINGADELYVGGVFGVNRGRLVQEHGITHILSVIKYSLNRGDAAFRDVEHLSIDIDDMEDQDILVHLPRMVRFIDRGLNGVAAVVDKPTTDDPPTPSRETITTSTPRRFSPGAVLVHCAMGKSRSVTAVLAYLLWKHPHRFGKADPTATTAQAAVAKALEWVRQTRPIAEPNDGFVRQLEMWWDMGCPADSDDAVERAPAYQRWLYKREVEDAARIGRAPDWILFEDEEETRQGGGGAVVGGGAKLGGTIPDHDGGGDGTELRCKKCRRVLATAPFIVPHQAWGRDSSSSTERGPECPHFFIEALSWMRPILEEGTLDGRLICPNAKCAASIGRYAWQGFKCSCGEWVAPAFSLQTSKVDKVATGGRYNKRGGAGALGDRMAALGIRMPPGTGARLPVAATAASNIERPKENL